MPQRLVVTDRPADLFRHIGLEHLRRPVPVVHLEQIDRDVVQEAREHDVLGLAFLLRVARALQHVRYRVRHEALPEEIGERRLRWHGRSA